MKKISIIYWSGTGCTEKMAKLILEGIQEVGSESVGIYKVSEVTQEIVDETDFFILGSPSMGMEVIEEFEMEPFVSSLEGKINGKKVALFGSYGWGDGQWIREWEVRMKEMGALLVTPSCQIQGEPQGGLEDECRQFGKKLIK